MSRTDKDRPYDVRAADPKEARLPHHNHLRFGKEVKVSRIKKDVYGNPVYETATTQRLVEVAVPAEESSTGMPATFKSWVEVKYAKAVYETVTLGFVADHCTLDEPHENIPNISRWRLFPCSYNLRVAHWDKPDAKDKRAYHGHARRGERDSLLRLSRLYNNGENIEEMAEVEDITSARENMHKGYWN